MTQSKGQLACASRYAAFRSLAGATELKLIYDDAHGVCYHKIAQTGNLEFYDYGTGYLNFEIATHQDHKNAGKYVIRTWIATIDDGDMGGWSSALEPHNARRIVHELAQGWLKPLVTFPALAKMNAELRGFGLYIARE